MDERRAAAALEQAETTGDHEAIARARAVVGQLAAAELYPLTRTPPLSLADRLCLAMAARVAPLS